MQRCGVMRLERGARSIAASIVDERLGVACLVLERLAQGKVEIRAVGRIGARLRRKREHVRDLGAIEADGLEVGETPICFTVARPECDRTAVGGDCLVLPANRAERVAERMPGLGIVGCRRQDRLIGTDRRSRIAQLHVDRRFEHKESGKTRQRLEREMDRRKRLLPTLEPVKRDRVCELCGDEVGRNAARLVQQVHDRREISLPQPDIGQQAHRAEIVEIDPEPPLERAARRRIAPLEERRSRIAECAIGDAARHHPRLRRIRLDRAPEQQQLVAKRVPCERGLRIGARGLVERIGGGLPRPQCGKRHAELVVNPPRLRHGGGERRQHITRLADLSHPAQRRAQQDARFDRITSPRQDAVDTSKRC